MIEGSRPVLRTCHWAGGLMTCKLAIVEWLSSLAGFLLQIADGTHSSSDAARFDKYVD